MKRDASRSSKAFDRAVAEVFLAGSYLPASAGEADELRWMAMLSPWWIHVSLAFATLFGWTLILVASFSSFRDWPHTGLRGNVERAAMYFLVAAVTRGTITNHQTRWQIALLAFSAALVEIGRGSLMGRSNGLIGWAASIAGIVSGGALMHYVAHDYYWRWGW